MRSNRELLELLDLEIRLNNPQTQFASERSVFVNPAESTEVTDQSTDTEDKLNQRIAIGKQLDLDIGKPNEHATLANGTTTQARDDLGLLLDPALYVKRACNDCYGRGLLIRTKPVTSEEAQALIAKDPKYEILLHQKTPGSYYTKESIVCGCVRKRYVAAYQRFAKALLSAGLAKHLAEAKRFELV